MELGFNSSLLIKRKPNQSHKNTTQLIPNRELEFGSRIGFNLEFWCQLKANCSFIFLFLVLLATESNLRPPQSNLMRFEGLSLPFADESFPWPEGRRDAAVRWDPIHLLVSHPNERYETIRHETWLRATIQLEPHSPRSNPRRRRPSSNPYHDTKTSCVLNFRALRH